MNAYLHLETPTQPPNAINDKQLTIENSYWQYIDLSCCQPGLNGTNYNIKSNAYL